MYCMMEKLYELILVFLLLQKRKQNIILSDILELEMWTLFYLEHESIHGNFNSKSITELIDDRDFTRKWFVSNDSIDICKDCQFRYICFDNSDIEFTGVSWKKVNQCQFDPYTNKWQREQDIL